MGEDDSLRQASPADLEALGALLDEAALDLLRRGIRQWSSPCDRGVLAREIRRRRVYLLGGGPDATFSVAPFAQSPLYPAVPEIFAACGKEFRPAAADGLYLCRAAVRPALQGRGLGRRLMRAAQELALARGLPLWLDCWAGNAKLREFYAGCGFRRLCDVKEPGEDYSVSVFYDEPA